MPADDGLAGRCGGGRDSNYTSRPYVSAGSSHDDYAPAYRYGMDAYARYGRHRSRDEVENDLGTGWDDARGNS